MARKHNILAAVIVMSAIGFTSCEPGETEAERDLNRLGNYLDSVKKVTPEYTAARWENIKEEYNETIAKIDVAGTKLSDEANRKLESVKAEYNKLKDDYTTHIKENDDKANAYKVNIRKSLFGDQEVGSDMQFKFVTAQNALSVYDRFVTNVKNNQNTYRREDWDEIKVLY
jgi:hypothetical protein